MTTSVGTSANRRNWVLHHLHPPYLDRNITRKGDPGGYWWPPTYSTWTPTIVSLSFLVSLIVAKFTIFGSFRVLNFWSRFEALNDVISALSGRENMTPLHNRYFPFMNVFLEEIFLTMYHACQIEVVCQIYDPGKLMYQVTQWGPHSGVSPPRVRFLDV